MVESNSDRPMRAPWHLWLVGLLATLWNGFAAFIGIPFMRLSVGAVRANMTPRI